MTTPKTVEESFHINWKAIASKRLLDAGVSPKTTVELVITLEELLEHHITTYSNARYEEGVKAEANRRDGIERAIEQSIIDQHVTMAVKAERERILKMVKRHYPSDWAVEQGKKEGKDRYALGGKMYLDLIVNALTPTTP